MLLRFHLVYNYVRTRTRYEYTLVPGTSISGKFARLPREQLAVRRSRLDAHAFQRCYIRILLDTTGKGVAIAPPLRRPTYFSLRRCRYSWHCWRKIPNRRLHEYDRLLSCFLPPMPGIPRCILQYQHIQVYLTRDPHRSRTLAGACETTIRRYRQFESICDTSRSSNLVSRFRGHAPHNCSSCALFTKVVGCLYSYLCPPPLACPHGTGIAR